MIEYYAMYNLKALELLFKISLQIKCFIFKLLLLRVKRKNFMNDLIENFIKKYPENLNSLRAWPYLI
jgi:hypothetical protein